MAVLKATSSKNTIGSEPSKKPSQLIVDSMLLFEDDRSKITVLNKNLLILEII